MGAEYVPEERFGEDFTFVGTIKVMAMVIMVVKAASNPVKVRVQVGIAAKGHGPVEGAENRHSGYQSSAQ